MAYDAEAWVRKQQVGNLTDRAVLLEIAYHVNSKTGLSCPGLHKLSTDLGASINTIRSAITRLEAAGFLKTEAVIANGCRAGTIYVLNGHDYSKYSVSISDIRKTLSSEEAQNDTAYGVRLKAMLDWWFEHFYLFVTNQSGGANIDISKIDTPSKSAEGGVSNFDTNHRSKEESKKKRKLLKEKTEPSLFDEQASKPMETDDVSEPDDVPEVKAEDVTLNLDAPATLKTAIERFSVTSMPATWREWVKERYPQFDPDFLWTDFVDYWGKDGAGASRKKKLWFSTFKNRVKLLPDFIQTRAVAAKSQPSTKLKATPPSASSFSDKSRYGAAAGTRENAIDVNVTEIINILIEADFDVMLNSRALMTAATHLAGTVDDVQTAARLLEGTPPMPEETPENYQRRLEALHELHTPRV